MFEARVALEAGEWAATRVEMRSAVGEAWRAEVDLVVTEPLDPAELVRKDAVLRLTQTFGAHVHFGLVLEARAHATADPSVGRRLTLVVVPQVALLGLRRQTKVYQHLSAPDLLEEVWKAAGLDPARLATELGEDHPELAYVTQYRETDLAFFRRICEESGIYWRFESKDDHEALVLCDRSSSAPASAASPLPHRRSGALISEGAAAFDVRRVRARRTGKVTLRAYDPERPALALEGVAEQGKDVEKAVERYAAPARFASPAEGKVLAGRTLEALRADGNVVELTVTAPEVVPGTLVDLDGDAPILEGAKSLFVVSTELGWAAGGEARTRVRAIPADVPYRLPLATPRPRALGVQAATVTGASGQEIHVDDKGCVRVRFPWDRGGPADDKSSLPVRVMHPNMPGSMLIPRVGWEVVVGFEDADPDRPYVLGRSYNAKQLPPVALPANKTMTALRTPSSPGGGTSNALTFDDAGGRQHMHWFAGFGKTTDVAANMLAQIVGFAKTSVSGSQSWSIGGSETVSIGNALLVSVASESISVGGSQDVLIKAVSASKVGSESVSVGGSLTELVGNPATGAANFAKAAALAGVGQIPVVGSALSKGFSTGEALAKGYQAGGVKGMLEAGAQVGTGMLANTIPGGDAIAAAADGAGLTPWSEKAKKAKGAAEGGGGAGGAGADGAAGAAAAPGHRKIIVDGAMSEAIGGVCSITSPGPIKWTTMGASTIGVAGSHSTTAVNVGIQTMGVSSDTASALSITAAAIVSRAIGGACSTTVAGTWSTKAGGAIHMKAGAKASVKVGGALKLDGGKVVFVCGGASVIVHGGGLLLKAPTITVNGKVTHSGSEDIG